MKCFPGSCVRPLENQSIFVKEAPYMITNKAAHLPSPLEPSSFYSFHPLFSLSSLSLLWSHVWCSPPPILHLFTQFEGRSSPLRRGKFILCLPHAEKGFRVISFLSLPPTVQPPQHWINSICGACLWVIEGTRKFSSLCSALFSQAEWEKHLRYHTSLDIVVAVQSACFRSSLYAFQAVP